MAGIDNRLSFTLEPAVFSRVSEAHCKERYIRSTPINNTALMRVTRWETEVISPLLRIEILPVPKRPYSSSYWAAFLGEWKCSAKHAATRGPVIL